MATINSSNQEYKNNADGFELAGGTTKRKLTVQSGDLSISAGSNTLSLSANLSTSGSNPLTLTTSATTDVTLPSSGTIASLAGSENLTSKIIAMRAGTTSAGTAPLKLAAGPLMTSAEAGALEFDNTTDRPYFTQTTATTRKNIAAYPATGATGDVYYRDASGNFAPLAAASDGAVLTVAGGLPSWDTSGAAISGIQYPIDDLANWTADIGYDQELNGTSASLPSGSWSWGFQSGATWTEGGGAGVLAMPGNTDGYYRGIVRSLPTPTAWTVTAKLVQALPVVNYSLGGLMIRDSSSGRMLTWNVDVSSKSVIAQFWSNLSGGGFSSQPFGSVYMDFPRYLRISRTSTTSYTFQYSSDGLGWVTASTGYNPTSYVATPNQIGLVVLRTTVVPAVMSVHWFRVR
jgi:hypothetical protein